MIAESVRATHGVFTEAFVWKMALGRTRPDSLITS
jgi:hypothetical protein